MFYKCEYIPYLSSKCFGHTENNNAATIKQRELGGERERERRREKQTDGERDKRERVTKQMKRKKE